jgi:hypothetical protein
VLESSLYSKTRQGQAFRPNTRIQCNETKAKELHAKHEKNAKLAHEELQKQHVQSSLFILVSHAVEFEI